MDRDRLDGRNSEVDEVSTKDAGDDVLGLAPARSLVSEDGDTDVFEAVDFATGLSLSFHQEAQAVIDRISASTAGAADDRAPEMHDVASGGGALTVDLGFSADAETAVDDFSLVGTFDPARDEAVGRSLPDDDDDGDGSLSLE